MLTVQHLYPHDDTLVAEHVRMLTPADNDDGDSRQPDIVHVHGCWNYDIGRQALRLHRQGARIVLTPHGGLEPWVIAHHRGEKFSKTLLWQRRLVESCYVVIVQGRMEAEAMKALGWNPRMETIRNAVVTNSITPEAMAANTGEVYRKVMDSNTLELMSDDCRRLLRLLLKVGITGDRRWISSDDSLWAAEAAAAIGEVQWRRLLIYADHENVRTIVDSGARHIDIKQPYLDTDTIKSYLPTGYERPKVKANDLLGIVGEIHKGEFTLRHLAELDRALRRSDVEDDWLLEAVAERQLTKYFRRLLQVLTEQTALDEGFLPVRPLDDGGTKKIRNLLKNHLRI